MNMSYKLAKTFEIVCILLQGNVKQHFNAQCFQYLKSLSKQNKKKIIPRGTTLGLYKRIGCKSGILSNWRLLKSFSYFCHNADLQCNAMQNK